MTNQIIPLLLNEEDCKALGKEWTLRFLDCSTTGVILQLNKYLDEGGADPDVENMIREFYINKRNEMGLSNGVEQEEDIGVVESLRIDTQFVYYTIDELINLDEIMTRVLSGADESVAYNLPISSKLFKSIIKEIKDNGNREQVDIAKRLEKHPAKGIFYDPPNARARKTQYKKVILNNTTMELISNGIKFLIEQTQAGVAPPQWRHL